MTRRVVGRHDQRFDIRILYLCVIYLPGALPDAMLGRVKGYIRGSSMR